MPLGPSCAVEENIFHLFFFLIHCSVEKTVKPENKTNQPANQTHHNLASAFLMLPLCFGTCISDWVKQLSSLLPKDLKLIAINVNLNCNCFSSSFSSGLVPLAGRDFLKSMRLKTTIAEIWFLKINSEWRRGWLKHQDCLILFFVLCPAYFCCLALAPMPWAVYRHSVQNQTSEVLMLVLSTFKIIGPTDICLLYGGQKKKKKIIKMTF